MNLRRMPRVIHAADEAVVFLELHVVGFVALGLPGMEGFYREIER